MLQEREAARKNKDWKRSDELRDALKDAGYIVEDTKNGQKVRKNV
jgi:cysteinyl-tRNA synthetase